MLNVQGDEVYISYDNQTHASSLHFYEGHRCIICSPDYPHLQSNEGTRPPDIFFAFSAVFLVGEISLFIARLWWACGASDTIWEDRILLRKGPRHTCREKKERCSLVTTIPRLARFCRSIVEPCVIMQDIILPRNNFIVFLKRFKNLEIEELLTFEESKNLKIF